MPLNTIFRHYKGGHYRLVTLTAKLESTGEHVVVYQSIDGNHCFVRPYTEFFGHVPHESGGQIARFTPVGEEPGCGQKERASRNEFVPLGSVEHLADYYGGPVNKATLEHLVEACGNCLVGLKIRCFRPTDKPGIATGGFTASGKVKEVRPGYIHPVMVGKTWVSKDAIVYIDSVDVDELRSKLAAVAHDQMS